jgi:hypothetical protein
VADGKCPEADAILAARKDSRPTSSAIAHPCGWIGFRLAITITVLGWIMDLWESWRRVYKFQS